MLKVNFMLRGKMVFGPPLNIRGSTDGKAIKGIKNRSKTRTQKERLDF